MHEDIRQILQNLLLNDSTVKRRIEEMASTVEKKIKYYPKLLIFPAVGRV